MSILDVFQSGNSLYERTEDSIFQLNSKLFLYTTEEGKKYIAPSDGMIIDDDEFDIYNNKIYKFYPKNIMSFWSKSKKIPEDKVFGIRDNPILYLKNQNITYEVDPSKYRIWYWDIETMFSDHNKPEDPQAPITAISIYDQNEDKYFVISWHPEKTKHIPHLKYDIKNETDEGEKVTYIKVKDEFNLLRMLVLLLKKYKPMLMIGWFSNFFDMPYVIKRMEVNNIDSAYLSPIKQKTYMRPTDENTYRVYIPGMYSIELNKVIERYATTVKFPSMNLGKVAQQLGFGDKLKVNFATDYENNFDYFLKYNINDVRLTKQINSAFGLIEMLIYVHSASGVNFDNILLSSHIVEDALILYSKDRVIPKTARAFRGYQGATVLKPLNQGLVSNVATLDANSMYPTSTITFNVSPETLICSHDDIDNMYKEDNSFKSIYNFLCNQANKALIDIEDKLIYKDNPRNYVYDILKTNKIDYIDTLHTDDEKELNEHGYLFFGHKFRQGIYPRYLMKVYGERKSIKSAMKELISGSSEYRLLDIQQNGLKLILNVVYGANGFASFRLYDPRIAETITYFARKLLAYAINYLEQNNYLIQYGDSVSEDTYITVKDINGIIKKVMIKDLFDTNNIIQKNEKEYNYISNLYTPSIDPKTGLQYWKPIKYIMRHIKPIDKNMYRVYTNKLDYIDVTDDHSLMTYSNDKNILSECNSNDLLTSKKILVYLENKFIDNENIKALLTKSTTIEKIEYSGYIYDIEVEDTHTFFGNNILVHNTDSLFVILHSKQYDKCYQEITELADRLNNSIYIDHTLKYSSDELSTQLQSYLGFKLEHILRTIYFSDSKKRYYGIDYDGEPYVKGMNVIRKDSPPLAKELLIKFISLILDNSLDSTELTKAIDTIKKAPLTQIGVVKSFGKSIESYDKTIPQHVRGVIFAEELLKTHIDSADKPYLFYIKPRSPEVAKKYNTFHNVICLNDKDIDTFLKQDEFEVDYIEFVKKQILTPLEEFEYAEGIKDMISELNYTYKYSELQQKFDF